MIVCDLLGVARVAATVQYRSASLSSRNSAQNIPSSIANQRARSLWAMRFLLKPRDHSWKLLSSTSMWNCLFWCIKWTKSNETIDRVWHSKMKAMGHYMWYCVFVQSSRGDKHCCASHSAQNALRSRSFRQNWCLQTSWLQTSHPA